MIFCLNSVQNKVRTCEVQYNKNKLHIPVSGTEFMHYNLLKPQICVHVYVCNWYSETVPRSSKSTL